MVVCPYEPSHVEIRINDGVVLPKHRHSQEVPTSILVTLSADALLTGIVS